MYYDLLNTKLSPEQTSVMRAVWSLKGWSSIDEICNEISSKNMNRNKVYRILCSLLEINFVSRKKYKGKNYYAQKIGLKQYYPDLHENPDEFLENEKIEIENNDFVYKIKKVKKLIK